MVRPAICTADRPSKMKKYNEDNRAVCVTRQEFDLELFDNSGWSRVELIVLAETSDGCSLKQAQRGHCIR